MKVKTYKVPLILAIWAYKSPTVDTENQEHESQSVELTQEIEYTPEWAKEYFNSRIRELVGNDKYDEVIEDFADQYPEEFSGCEDYLFETSSKRSNIFDLRRLLEEKKYKEVIALSNKYVKDSEVWYCDWYFWELRARAFANLNNCPMALKEAVHAFAGSPPLNEIEEPLRELYFSIGNSDVCKND